MYKNAPARKKAPVLFSREQTGSFGLTGSFSLCYDKEKKFPTPVSAKEVDRMSHTLLKILPLWAGLWQMLNGVILIGVLALIVLGCIALWKYIRRT